jgi:hypothetical protein
MLEALAAVGQPATGEVGLGEPGFRPAFEGDPFGLARERERALERFAGIVELLAQEMGATHERERERSLLAAAGALCQLDRTPQVAERPLVGARVGGRQAEHRLDPARSSSESASAPARSRRWAQRASRACRMSTYASSRWAAAARSPSQCSSASRVARSSPSAPSSSQPRAEWTSAVPRASQDSASSPCAPHAFASAAARASERTPDSKLPAWIAERPASRRARAACFPAAPVAGTAAGGLASAARKTAAPGSLPCSARKSSTQAETCRSAASRSPASE